ncbi:MAG: hypothetical protein VX589_13090 [Myxococcota bacterium]|nr:hypothetical protein [Myxococcota bacterium]
MWLGLMGVGCSTDATFLDGAWQVDLASTVAELASTTDLKLGAQLDVTALDQDHAQLVVRFDRSNQVHLTLGNQTVTRSFKLVKAKGNAVALSIQTGPHVYRRVVATLEDKGLALVDSHQRIILKRR